MLTKIPRLSLNILLATPVMLAHQKQTTYLRIGMVGGPLPRRSPINLALVLDKSNSMQGQKLQQLKQAARLVIQQLDKEDVLSLIAYDHHVHVLLPATPVTDKRKLYAVIDKLVARGNTALFSGVEQGGKEIRKFASLQRVNRIILVSDGQANIGPHSPEELGLLGATLGQEGTSITTMGLGLSYNEDAMTQLARRSEGNHAFAEHATDLAPLFEHELKDIFSIVAQNIQMTVAFKHQIRPLRLLSHPPLTDQGKVHIVMNQLGSQQEKYLLLEIEVPPLPIDDGLHIADIQVHYQNMQTSVCEHLTHPVFAKLSSCSQTVKEKTNAVVMLEVVEQLSLENHQLSIQLRDQGHIDEAREVLLENAVFLQEQAAKYDSGILENLKSLNLEDAQNLEDQHWKKQRKLMRYQQYKLEKQQSY